MLHKTQKSATCTITLRDDGILVVDPDIGSKQDIGGARENLQIGRELLKGRCAPVLVNLRNSGEMTREARQIYANEAEFAIAQALLVESPFTRILANLYIRVSKPSSPVRLFVSEDLAVDWLLSLLRQETQP